MGAEEFLRLVDQLVFSVTSEYLSDLRRNIFLRSWEGRTYGEIAQELGYEETYIRDEGATIFRYLRDAIGEPVTKNNFRSALERYHQSLNSVLPPAKNYQSNGIDPNFIGRESAIAELNQRINQGSRLILIQGEGGRGKTTLARKYFETQGFTRKLELWMATERHNIMNVESVVEEWLRRDFNEEPGRDFGINLDRLKRRLRDTNQRIGILIDNLESALDTNGKFIEKHRPYVDLLKVLSDSSVSTVTLITSRERLSESSITVDRYLLEGLDQNAWRQFFRNCGLEGESAAIAEMCNAYGGNAKAMKLLSGVILQDFEEDIEAFWRENYQDLLLEPELKDLVSSQFDRLQNAKPEAYKLLCRLGCYRYQEINHVPLEGVDCLLWDSPKESRRSIIRSLQDRSLIEVRRGTKYWLHPVIQAEAINRLRQQEDYQFTNLAAAEYWRQSVQTVETVDDALRSLEAYYHYVEIQAYEKASDVLITELKDSRWGEGLPLGWLFYRFGLLQQMITAITRIIHHIHPDHRAGSLYILLGYIYRLAGNIHQAIACHREASKIAEQFRLEQLKISALFNRGLCLRDLGELEDAIAIFHQVISLVDTNVSLQRYEHKTYSLCCLAYLNSRLGQVDIACSFIQQAIQRLQSTKLTFWGKGYSLLFIGSTYRNIKDLDNAFHFYQQTIQLSEENHFTQIRAKALHGMAQLHREQGQFDGALQKHHEAIQLLDKIGAKCDLAEAYYQLGTTYQKMGDRNKSIDSFQCALQLFNLIQAPKQAEQTQQKLQKIVGET